MGSAWTEIDQKAKEIKMLNRQLDEAKESKSVYAEIMNDADDELEVWDGLKEELENGKPVFAPKKATKKRKAIERHKRTKRRRLAISSESEDNDSSTSEENEDETIQRSSSQSEREELNEEQISAKISDIRANKKNARQQKNNIEAKIDELKRNIKSAREEEEKAEAEVAARCM